MYKFGKAKDNYRTYCTSETAMIVEVTKNQSIKGLVEWMQENGNDMAAVEYFDICYSSDVSNDDLEYIHNFPNIKVLRIEHCQNITHLDSLSKLDLKEVHLFCCRNIRSIDGLGNSHSLENFSVLSDGAMIKSFDVLGSLKNLEEFFIRDYDTDEVSFDALADLPIRGFRAQTIGKKFKVNWPLQEISCKWSEDMFEVLQQFKDTLEILKVSMGQAPESSLSALKSFTALKWFTFDYDDFYAAEKAIVVKDIVKDMDIEYGRICAVGGNYTYAIFKGTEWEIEWTGF
jgi:hypothetical protein